MCITWFFWYDHFYGEMRMILFEKSSHSLQRPKRITIRSTMRNEGDMVTIFEASIEVENKGGERHRRK
jgi:hypothetical protein